MLLALAPGCSTRPIVECPLVQNYQGATLGTGSPANSDEVRLRVMTMNAGHGRGDGFHQLTESSAEIRANLDRVLVLLNEETPDIAAFQEIDAPSFWSGNFNHVDYLGERGGFRQSIMASHVEIMGLSYGTAMLSRFALSNPVAVTFNPPMTTVPTGFIMATVRLPTSADLVIDVVCAHLDFMSAAMRKKQVDELVALVKNRKRPVIVMGDLNAGWSAQGSTVQYLIEQLGLKAYQPENRQLVTFPALNKRLDWILVSEDFGFSSYQVVGSGLSDHNGVLAEVVMSAK